QPGIHSRLLNVHSRIVADRSIRYAGDDPTFVEQSARIVLHRDRGDDQGFGSQHLDEGVELRNNSGCEGGELNGYRYWRISLRRTPAPLPPDWGHLAVCRLRVQLAQSRSRLLRCARCILSASRFWTGMDRPRYSKTRRLPWHDDRVFNKPCQPRGTWCSTESIPSVAAGTCPIPIEPRRRR